MLFAREYKKKTIIFNSEPSELERVLYYNICELCCV